MAIPTYVLKSWLTRIESDPCTLGGFLVGRGGLRYGDDTKPGSDPGIETI